MGLPLELSVFIILPQAVKDCPFSDCPRGQDLKFLPDKCCPICEPHVPGVCVCVCVCVCVHACTHMLVNVYIPSHYIQYTQDTAHLPHSACSVNIYTQYELML